MNPKHHGDAKDLFKRGLLNLMRSLSAVRDIRVLPFFTDDYEPADVASYAKVLGIREDEIVSRERFYPRQGRDNYIAAARAVPEQHDLFLDPDRGVVAELHDGQRDRELISCGELAALLVGSTRLLVVYDESVDRADRERVTVEKLDALRTAGLAAFAYFNESPNHPNILAVTQHAGERLARFRAELTDVGGISAARLLPRL